MIKTVITPSHILVFSLLSSVADAQSGSSPEASPNAPTDTWDVSLAPVLVAVVCVFFFVSSFAIYLDHCCDLNLAAGDPTGDTDNCSSSGIDPRLLDTFPILVYPAVEHLKFGKAAVPECAVCLSEFDPRDRLRLIPKCNHVFHSQCIDAWLASHVTCPVCRSRLKPAEEQRRDENDVVIVIPNESSERRTELH